MSHPIVFYAWQNDRPRASVRDLIRSAADCAVATIAANMSVADAPRLDHDTLSESGTPAISETIFSKIRRSAVFVADVTFVGEVREQTETDRKRLPNPNVMVEIGYAAATIGWPRIILIMNTHYGSPSRLPFDLKNRKFPITYKLGPKSAQADIVKSRISAELELAITDCLSKEYELVDDILSRLSSYTRKMMLEHGAAQSFWETKQDNVVISRMDLAIAQMLELKLTRCIESASESRTAYAWTYLGNECCRRLGVIPAVPLNLDVPMVDPVMIDMTAYDQILLDDELQNGGGE